VFTKSFVSRVLNKDLVIQSTLPRTPARSAAHAVASTNSIFQYAKQQERKS
jgi:hypothetical protein